MALFLSFFFLVTHELVPHRHHEELTENEHQKEHRNAQNVMDFFSLVFHQNLGGHHLQEILVTTNQQEISNQVQVQEIKVHQYSNLPSNLYFSQNKFSKANRPNDSANPYFSFFNSYHQRRGPPLG